MIIHVAITIDEPTAQKAAMAYLKIQKAYKPVFPDPQPVAFRAEDQMPFDMAVAKIRDDWKPGTYYGPYPDAEKSGPPTPLRVDGPVTVRATDPTDT